MPCFFQEYKPLHLTKYDENTSKGGKRVNNFIIIESGCADGDFVRASLIRHGVSVSGQGMAGFSLLSARSLEEIRDSRPDALFMAPGAAAAPGRPVECGMAVIPGSSSLESASRLLAQSVISYGMSGRDTFTVSSLDDRVIMLTLQREIASIKGRIIDRQDFAVNRFSRASCEAHLLAAAACIIAGVPAGALYKRHIFSR